MNTSSPSSSRDNYWKTLGWFTVFTLAFVWLEFAAQYYWLERGNMEESLIKSLGLSGATFLSLTLLGSVIFKAHPLWAKHWRIRRYLGVAGFLFVFFHVFTASKFLFNFDLAAIYFSWNPLENPLVFGQIAYVILFLLTITSTDWAVRVMTPRWWKRLHRLVYVAYVATIYHFFAISPGIANSFPGLVLVIVTAAAVIGQLYWFIRLGWRKKFLSFGLVLALLFLAASVVVGYWVMQTYGLF